MINCGADHYGIQAFVRARRMPAAPLDLDVDRVGRRHDRTGTGRKRADRKARVIVHTKDLVDGEAFHQPVPDHRGRARAALLSRLKDHHRIPGEVPGLGEITRGAEQHRGVAVMAAGVHLAGCLRGVSEVGFFLDRQRIHIGAEPDHLEIADGRLFALDDADHAGPAKAGRDLVAAELLQAIRHECRGAMHIVEQLGMLMDIPAPGLDIGLQIGDAVDDRHGNPGCPM